jgi:hypothetical protein
MLPCYFVPVAVGSSGDSRDVVAAARKVRIACRNSEGAWVMKVVHRIGFRATGMQRRALEALGVKLPSAVSLPGGGEPLLTFDVDEDHPNWSLLSALFDGWDVFNMVRTEFTRKELESARWLEVGAWHHGYPQPHDDELGYLQATYDLTDWCESCGIGMKQKAPFQMKREPKWGRNAIMQLTWVYDELFVTPDTWIHAFKPAGVGCRPVLNTKGVELKTVVQLVVETSVGIVTDGLAFERCERCGRTKYPARHAGRISGASRRSDRLARAHGRVLRKRRAGRSARAHVAGRRSRAQRRRCPRCGAQARDGALERGGPRRES